MKKLCKKDSSTTYINDSFFQNDINIINEVGKEYNRRNFFYNVLDILIESGNPLIYMDLLQESPIYVRDIEHLAKKHDRENDFMIVDNNSVEGFNIIQNIDKNKIIYIFFSYQEKDFSKQMEFRNKVSSLIKELTVLIGPKNRSTLFIASGDSSPITLDLSLPYKSKINITNICNINSIEYTSEYLKTHLKSIKNNTSNHRFFIDTVKKGSVCFIKAGNTRPALLLSMILKIKFWFTKRKDFDFFKILAVSTKKR